MEHVLAYLIWTGSWQRLRGQEEGQIICDNHSCAALNLSEGKAICFVIHCDNIDCFSFMVLLKPICNPIRGRMRKEIRTLLVCTAAVPLSLKASHTVYLKLLTKVFELYLLFCHWEKKKPNLVRAVFNMYTCRAYDSSGDTFLI